VHRVRPEESGFPNPHLAGDWTRNGVAVGTVDGSVMSGLKAARSISGAPTYIVGADDLERGSALQPARVDESAARPARPRRRLSLIAIVRQVARFAGARQQSRITF